MPLDFDWNEGKEYLHFGIKLVPSKLHIVELFTHAFHDNQSAVG